MVLFADSVAFRSVPLFLVMASLQDTRVVLLIWVPLPTVLVRQVAWLDREPLAPSLRSVEGVGLGPGQPPGIRNGPGLARSLPLNWLMLLRIACKSAVVLVRLRLIESSALRARLCPGHGVPFAE